MQLIVRYLQYLMTSNLAVLLYGDVVAMFIAETGPEGRGLAVRAAGSGPVVHAIFVISLRGMAENTG